MPAGGRLQDKSRVVQVAGFMILMLVKASHNAQRHIKDTERKWSLLCVPVDGGYDGCGGLGCCLFLRLLLQLLANVWGGVRALEFRLLPFAVGIRLGRLRRFLLDCGRRGWRRLGNGHLGGVQVDAVGGGVVVSVGASHRVQELDHTMEMDDKNNK